MFRSLVSINKLLARNIFNAAGAVRNCPDALLSSNAQDVGTYRLRGFPLSEMIAVYCSAEKSPYSFAFAGSPSVYDVNR